MWPNRQLFVAELEQFVLVFYDVLPHPGAITTRRDEDRGVLDFVLLLLLFRVRTQFEPRHREICWHILPEECLERPDVAVVEASVERRCSDIGNCVDIGAVLEENVDAASATRLACDDEGCLAFTIFAFRVSPCLQEYPCAFGRVCWVRSRFLTVVAAVLSPHCHVQGCALLVGLVVQVDLRVLQQCGQGVLFAHPAYFRQGRPLQGCLGVDVAPEAD